jgi:hypothetical protein
MIRTRRGTANSLGEMCDKRWGNETDRRPRGPPPGRPRRGQRSPIGSGRAGSCPLSFNRRSTHRNSLWLDTSWHWFGQPDGRGWSAADSEPVIAKTPSCSSSSPAAVSRSAATCSAELRRASRARSSLGQRPCSRRRSRTCSCLQPTGPVRDAAPSSRQLMRM